MVGLIDYGMGNLRSVLNAVEFLGSKAELVADPNSAANAERLILPGVGAFGAGMRRLDEYGLAEALPELVRGGRLLLGICLGMQLLADAGSEYGEHKGLGLISGRVDRIKADGLRIPHVGWNEVAIERRTPLLADLAEDPTFYFVHSYEFRPADPAVTTATTDYGGPVTAVVEDGSVHGVQFHPEKSQKAGLTLLRSFLDIQA